MRKAVIPCVMLWLVCGSVHGLDYTWVNHSTDYDGAAQSWAIASNWDQNAVPGAGDAARILIGRTRLVGTPFSTTVGSVLFDNGAAYKSQGDYGFTVGGDFLYKSTGTPYTSNRGGTFDVGGNFYWSTAMIGDAAKTDVIILRGANKALKILYTGWGESVDRVDLYGSCYDNGSALSANWKNFDELRVKSGGVILPRADGVLSTWRFATFTFEGGQAGLPAFGANVNFDYNAHANLVNTAKLCVTGGVTYPQDVAVGLSRYGGGQFFGNTFTWKIKGGDVKVARDFSFKYLDGGADTASNFWLDTLENGTATSRNITVGGNFQVGSDRTDVNRYGFWGARFNNSVIDVGGDFLVGSSDTTNSGTVNFGSSTVYVGKNLTFRVPTAWTSSNWNAGSSMVVFDGNGTYNYAQTLRTNKLLLHDVRMSNPGGSVTLADNLNLTGNLLIDCNTFSPAAFYVNFKGGFDNLPAAQQIDAHNANLRKIHLMAGSSTWARLMSDLTVSDNLDIDAGCKLFLNGFTLTAINSDLKQNYSGDGTWSVREGGEIIGGNPIPEPATLLLLGTGLASALASARRRR